MHNIQHHSISKKLTRMNMLVSGTALLLACAAFFVYDLNTFRAGIVHNLSWESEVKTIKLCSFYGIDTVHS